MVHGSETVGLMVHGSETVDTKVLRSQGLYCHQCPDSVDILICHFLTTLITSTLSGKIANSHKTAEDRGLLSIQHKSI